MPFSKAHNGKDELTSEDLNYIYKDMIKKAIEEFEIDGKQYFNSVLRYEEKVGSIINGIVQKIKEADLVIADLTGLNPNVMYELGVRHALKRGTIMLTQNFDNFPSDLRDYMTVVYRFSDKIHDQQSNYEHFKQNLHRSIEELLKSNKKDSPVLDYLEKKELYRNEKEIEELKQQAIMLDSIVEDVEDISQIVSKSSPNESPNSETLILELINFHLNCLVSKFQLINIPVTTNLLYEDLINITSLLTEVMKKSTINEYFSDLPIEAGFEKVSIESILAEEFINPILLKDKKEIEYVAVKQLFSEGSFLYEFLEDIEDYINEEAVRLGIEKEIEELYK